MNNKFYNEKHPNALVVYLSDVEAKIVRKWAAATKSKSVSSFLRNSLYMIGCCNVRLRVAHDDLNKLTQELELFNQYMINLLVALAERTEVEMEDVAEIQRKMDEIKAVVMESHEAILAGRREHESQVDRYLEELVEEILDIDKDTE